MFAGLLFGFIFVLRVYGSKLFLPLLAFLNLGLLFYLDHLTFLIGLIFITVTFFCQKSRKALIVILWISLFIFFIAKSKAFIFFNPKGLSYFIFPFLGFLIDRISGLKSQDWVPIHRFFGAQLYFPTQIAGPIYSVSNLLEQFSKRLPLCAGNVRANLLLIAYGALKLAIYAFFEPRELEAYQIVRVAGFEVIFLALNITIEYYLNLSGYTDIVRGLSGMLNLELPLNFNLPFLAQDVGDHWRRWHMSLVNWFGKYVYFPLHYKLSRKCKVNGVGILSLMLTAILIGLWHEVNLNYLIWGLCNGFLILVTPLLFKPLRKNIFGLTLSIAMTIILTSLVRLLTISTDFSYIRHAFNNLIFIPADYPIWRVFSNWNLYIALLLMILSTASDWIFLKHFEILGRHKIFWPCLIGSIVLFFYFYPGSVEVLYGEF